jgi:hypothetical protein
MGFFDFGKRKLRTRRSVKKVRKPPAALLRKCRKCRIKTTVRKGGKRVYRKVSLLKKLLKRKMKKMKKMKRGKRSLSRRRSRRSGFGGSKKMTLEECKRRDPMMVLNKKGTECQFPEATKDECIRQNREWFSEIKKCGGPNEIINGEPYIDPNNAYRGELMVEKDNNGKILRVKWNNKYIAYNWLVKNNALSPFADRMIDVNNKEYFTKRNGLETDVMIDGKWVDYKSALQNKLIGEVKRTIVQFGRRRSRRSGFGSDKYSKMSKAECNPYKAVWDNSEKRGEQHIMKCRSLKKYNMKKCKALNDRGKNPPRKHYTYEWNGSDYSCVLNNGELWKGPQPDL